MVTTLDLRAEQPVAPLVLARAPEVVIARVALGVTLYLDDPIAWAREGALAALRLWRAAVPRPRVHCFTTSAMDRWEPATELALARIEDALPLPWSRERPRHLLRLSLADRDDAPEAAFHYREMDPARGPAVSTLELQLPASHAADDLLHLVVELAQQLPIAAVVGGFVVSRLRDAPSLAFPAAYRWCRRYLGLDVPCAEVFAVTAREALPSSNWITGVGASLRARLPRQRLPTPPSLAGVRTLRLRHADLLVAGDAPTLGDVNTLQSPTALAAAAHTLAPLLGQPSAALPHWSDTEAEPIWASPERTRVWRDETRAWARRLVEPDGWCRR